MWKWSGSIKTFQLIFTMNIRVFGEVIASLKTNVFTQMYISNTNYTLNIA